MYMVSVYCVLLRNCHENRVADIVTVILMVGMVMFVTVMVMFVMVIVVFVMVMFVMVVFVMV